MFEYRIYVSALLAFFLIFAVSLPAQATLTLEQRCEMSQAFSCIGFNNDEELAAGILTNNAQGERRAFLDTEVMASGSASLRFDILQGTGANSAGGWIYGFGRKFKPGQVFYVQFRQRINEAMVNENFGGGGWKTMILFQDGVSCGPVEVAVTNGYYADRPVVYSHCGARGVAIAGTGNANAPVSETNIPLQWPLKNGEFVNVWKYDYLTQQSELGQGYLCHYQAAKNTPDSCFEYQPNQWMTFTYGIKVGTFGEPNTVIKAWVGLEGQPSKQFVHRTDYTLYSNSEASASTDGFNMMMFTPYDTGKKTTAEHRKGQMWIDDLIISENPIPDPYAVIEEKPLPAPEKPPVVVNAADTSNDIILKNNSIMHEGPIVCELPVMDSCRTQKLESRTSIINRQIENLNKYRSKYIDSKNPKATFSSRNQRMIDRYYDRLNAKYASFQKTCKLFQDYAAELIEKPVRGCPPPQN